MSQKKCSDEDFIRLFESLGAQKTASEIGVAPRNVSARRRNLEKQIGRELISPTGPGGSARPHVNRWRGESRKRLEIRIYDGILFGGSDWHLWPGYKPTALRAMVHLGKELGVTHVVANGDVCDFPAISRHPPTGWSRLPTVMEELECVDEGLTEVRLATPNAQHIWLWGNHDYRFESRLIERGSEYKGVKGFALPDHFPHWKFGISLFINDNVVIKHRFKGGIHATHNNAMWSGRTIGTGHLHSLKICPYDDYNGTRYGVDMGTMNDPYGPHAEYTEDNPLNHRSGFSVWTFVKGMLLMPELVAVIDEDHVQFRGKIISV